MHGVFVKYKLFKKNQKFWKNITIIIALVILNTIVFYNSVGIYNCNIFFSYVLHDDIKRQRGLYIIITICFSGNLH
jgi:hypothetical protein